MCVCMCYLIHVRYVLKFFNAYSGNTDPPKPKCRCPLITAGIYSFWELKVIFP